MSKMEIINIERGMPTVEEAIRRMNMGLSTARGRGMKAAKKRMIAAMDEELVDRFSDIPAEELKLGAAYTCDEETANAWKKALEEHFGKPCEMDPLPLSIACHTGPGAIAAGFVRVYPGE